MKQTILIYNDLIVTFYEKLNVLNLFMEFFHIGASSFIISYNRRSDYFHGR